MKVFKKITISLFLVIELISMPSATALTIEEAVTNIQGTDISLPTGVAHPKGSIGFILANIFGSGSISFGKIQSKYIDYAGISAWTQSGSDIFYNGTGSVGIGTVNPSAKLEVSGQIKITG